MTEWQVDWTDPRGVTRSRRVAASTPKAAALLATSDREINRQASVFVTRYEPWTTRKPNVWAFDPVRDLS